MTVHNGLTHLIDCIESIWRHTTPERFHLFVVDDASDGATRRYLETLTQAHSEMTLVRNATNRGYLRSCNAAVSLGTSPYVVLINSDVIVTPRWLEKLVVCAESDSTIASVNPLTNCAAQIELPLPPGANFYGLNWYLERHAPRASADVVTGVGFCMLLRRSALNEVGLFDEIYGHGYCEESDLCMRLKRSGFRTVVAQDVYVYHKGGGSFTDSGARYRRNRAIFDTRWKAEYWDQFNAFRRADPLAPARALVELRRRWDPKPVIWETARDILTAWRDRAPVPLMRAGARGLIRLSRAHRECQTAAGLAKTTPPGRLRVTYVLHRLVISGGVLSVVQLVNELILRGVEARIVALFEDPAIYRWTKLLTRPIIFRSPAELLRNFPETDIAVATFWQTAYWVADLVQRGSARSGVYLVQDYEPWFYPEDHGRDRARASASYRLIPNKIVMSDWLRDVLAANGASAQKIPLGMDLAQFYPREVPRSSNRILAMARPGTPWRGFQALVAALALVKDALPHAEIVFFGDRFLGSHAIPFRYRDEGVVFEQTRLAELYSESTVFVDGSDFQGFGRCGLEAMQCGAACVLTGVGGVNEYASNGRNALLVRPQQPEELAAAVIRLLKDATLRRALVRQGHVTARRYCHKLAAQRTLSYFESIITERDGEIGAAVQ